MKRLIMYVLLAGGFFSLGCNKNPSNSDSGFSSKLTLGTGMSGFNLINEGTSFTRIGSSVMIYFRLESASDMAGSNVTINVAKNVSGSWSNYNSFSFTNPQSYGHILLSSFSIPDAGSFRATGTLVTGNVTVATIDFTVQ